MLTLGEIYRDGRDATLAEAIGNVELRSKAEARQLLDYLKVAEQLNSGHCDVLRAAYSAGPLFDGDVPSKGHRDECLEWGLIEKVWVKGEDGFNALTHRGGRVLVLACCLGRDHARAK